MFGSGEVCLCGFEDLLNADMDEMKDGEVCGSGVCMGVLLTKVSLWC